MRFFTPMKGIALPQFCVTARHCDIEGLFVFFPQSQTVSSHACSDQGCAGSSKRTLKISDFSMYEALFSIVFCSDYPSLFGLTRFSAPSFYSWSQRGSAWVDVSFMGTWDYMLQTGAIMGLKTFVLCLSGISVTLFLYV